MGAIHHKFKEVSLAEIRRAPIVILASKQKFREEKVIDGSLEYKKVIERYLVEKCYKGELQEGEIIEVFCSRNGRYRQFAKDLQRGISRHSIELGFTPPEREYKGEDKSLVLLLNPPFGADQAKIYAHQYPGLILHAGWREEFESEQE